MRVQLSNAEYQIIFRYDKTDPASPHNIDKTLCIITDISNQNLKSFGGAWCAEGDVFRKATGRKIALKRAIKGFTREERRIIWTEYFKTHKK